MPGEGVEAELRERKNHLEGHAGSYHIHPSYTPTKPAIEGHGIGAGFYLLHADDHIPSPIPYLMEVPDLRAHNTTYDWRLLFMLVLMGLGSGRTNVLAIAQWVQEAGLAAQPGPGSAGQRSGPAGAGHPLSICVGLQQAAALEQALKQWTKAVWIRVRPSRSG
jgi:hypothetical protein